MQFHGTLMKRALLPAVFAFVVGGCDSFLDVNRDPNAPETARIDLRLAGLIGAFAHSTYYGETALWGSEWTQQFSYNGNTRSYAEVHRYELQDTDGSSSWEYFYAGPLNEANNMMKEATGENDVVFRGLGKFFYAWIFAHITDLWGPAPYTDAFNTTIREPKYDEQKLIYENVHRLFNEAITDMSDATARRPTTNDLLFNGDMTRWVKLARYVQARHHLRLAYAPGEDKVARANQALTAIGQAFTSNADDADFTYTGGDGARNPLWTFQQLQTQLVTSEYMINLLKGHSDPRLPVMARPIYYDSVRATTKFAAAPNTFRGHRNGSGGEADSTISWVGPFFTDEAADLNIASYADQKFTEAEARLIVSGAAAADAPYRDGIRANMQKLGVAAAAIDAYIAARPSLTTLPNALEEIITQKYIANYLKVEPWNDWRRTGFPRLSIVEGAVLPGIPQRVRTPGSELTNNFNQVTATGIPTGLEGMSVKVWWATQGPR